MQSYYSNIVVTRTRS